MKNAYSIVTIVLLWWCCLFAQTNSLVAYFPFNGNADDESGNGNHGSVVGATLTEDRFGNDSSAYSFNGIDNYIGYPTLWSSSPSALTMSAWFNSLQTEGEGKILYHGDNGEFQLISIGDTAVGAVHLPSNWYFSYATTILSTWHFLVGVWEQEGSILLYLDGNLVDSISIPNELLLDVGPTYLPSIGSYNRTVGAFYTGKIDDVRIYDRALSVDEIDSLFNKGTTAVEEIGSTIPHTFELSQNYPNPFNPSTTIRFELPVSSQVDLRIYNLLGQEAAVLINNEEFSSGIYKYNFNASQLTSGVYFYRLKAGSFVETKKMILIK